MDASSGHLRRLPLAGFQADTAGRAAFLRLWNRLQARRARKSGWRLRIATHPRDAELPLAADLEQLLTRVEPSMRSDA